MEKVLDKLTGLYSEAEVNREIDALIDKGDEFVVVMLDADAFHRINVEIGHDTGDVVLRHIASCLSEVFPTPAMLFRGGDMFIALLPDCIKEEAFLRAERFRELVHAADFGKTYTDGTPLKQSVSVGVSSYPEDGMRPAEILRKADGALMRAKKNGRNQVCLSREEKMMPKTSHYTQHQLEKLTTVSKKQGIGEAVLLREALDELLKKYSD